MDKFISDVLLWTPSHGRAKLRRPARTYIQQLCANTGCSMEDVPGMMDERDGCERGSGRLYLFIFLNIYKLCTQQVKIIFPIFYCILGSIPGRVIPKTLKTVLDTSLLNTQQYKVCIKGKVEQSRERSSTLPYISV